MTNTPNIIAARLVAMGGREWKSQNSDKHRVYIKSDIAHAWAGVEYLQSSGKYRFAGETISAYRMKDISLVDFYYDVPTDTFPITGKHNHDTHYAAVAHIRAVLATEPDAATVKKMEVAEQIRALDAEEAELGRDMTQMQREAQSWIEGDKDPRYPEMNARFVVMQARVNAIASERYELKKTIREAK